MRVRAVDPGLSLGRRSGNKLFQGRFIEVMYGKPTLLVTLEWTLVNSCIALVGYYVAAFTIDHPWMGRWRMQGASA